MVHRPSSLVFKDKFISTNSPEYKRKAAQLSNLLALGKALWQNVKRQIGENWAENWVSEVGLTDHEIVQFTSGLGKVRAEPTLCTPAASAKGVKVCVCVYTCKQNNTGTLISSSHSLVKVTFMFI